MDLTREQMQSILTAAYQAEIRSKGRELDDYTRAKLGSVAAWLTNRQLKPSLMLCGGIGNGKTTMLTAIHKTIKELKKMERYENRLWNVTIYSADKINEAASLPLQDAYNSVCTTPWLAIDDMGTESPVIKVFGTERNPVGNLICERYKKNSPMIITTNLSLDHDIPAIYGERVSDRLIEMCEVLVYDNQSYRR